MVFQLLFVSCHAQIGVIRNETEALLVQVLEILEKSANGTDIVIPMDFDAKLLNIVKCAAGNPFFETFVYEKGLIY